MDEIEDDEEPEPVVAEEYLGDAVRTCQRCLCEFFLVWCDRGIWYAACKSCANEYGLFPAERFVLLREPIDEPEFTNLKPPPAK